MTKRFVGDEVKRRVDMLMEAIDPKPDEVYLHEDLATTADCKYGTPRYRSVIASWRRRLMRERNIDISAIPSHGYRILNDNDRVSVGIKDFSLSVRRMGRSVTRIERADTVKLDDHHRRQQDHAKRLRELVELGRASKKKIALSATVVALPRKKISGE